MGLQEIKSLAFAFFWIDLLFLPAFQSVKLPFQGSLHHTKQYPDSWARNAKKSWIFQKIRLRNILRQECQASKYKYKELYLACIFQNNFYNTWYSRNETEKYLLFENMKRDQFSAWPVPLFETEKAEQFQISALALLLYSLPSMMDGMASTGTAAIPAAAAAKLKQ